MATTKTIDSVSFVHEGRTHSVELLWAEDCTGPDLDYYYVIETIGGEVVAGNQLSDWQKAEAIAMYYRWVAEALGKHMMLQG